MSLSRVNFVIKTFEDFTLNVNIETLNTERKSDQIQRCGCGARVGDDEDHKFGEELRSCQHFLVNSELERARQKNFKHAVENLRAKIVSEKFDHLFNNLKCGAEVNLAFVIILRNVEDGGFRYFLFLRTRKRYPDGMIRNCVQQEKLGKTKRLSQQN